MNIDFLNNIQENIEKKFETLKEDISDNLIDEASKKLGLDNEEFSLDRFEENMAVIEDRKTGKMKNISKEKLPIQSKEGDIIKCINGKYFLDIEETEKIEKDMQEKYKNLWE